MEKTKPGRRYPLLIYRRLFGAYRWVGFWLALASALLWWYAPIIPLVAPREGLPLVITLLGAALFLFSFVAERGAYVQCRAEHLLICTPIFRMTVSYARIQEVRPIDLRQMFPPREQPPGQRWLLESLYAYTAVGINLKGYPLSEKVLRLFFHRRMFSADQPGLVLIVGPDWMGLSTEISSHQGRWRTDRIDAQRPKLPTINPYHEN